MRHRWVGLGVKLGTVLTALAVTLLSAQPALAWTHLINNWDTSVGHSDYTCGYSTSVPCLYWPEPNHGSSVIYAYLDPSVTNVGGYDFTPAITRAINDFNNVPALNPYMYVCSGPSQCGNAQVTYQAGPLDPGVTGFTTYDYYGSITQTSGQYYAIMYAKSVTFSTNYTWNNNLYFDNTTYSADGRKVATHETGHVQGLGHTNFDPAVMRPGAVSYYSLQPNDINGLESIYTGYIPA